MALFDPWYIATCELSVSNDTSFYRFIVIIVNLESALCALW